MVTTNIKKIRDRIGITQAALGAELGCTQANVSAYERGQSIPSDMAGKLIEVARRYGLEITYNDIYGHVTFGITTTDDDGLALKCSAE